MKFVLTIWCDSCYHKRSSPEYFYCLCIGNFIRKSNRVMQSSSTPVQHRIPNTFQFLGISTKTHSLLSFSSQIFKSSSIKSTSFINVPNDQMPILTRLAGTEIVLISVSSVALYDWKKGEELPLSYINWIALKYLPLCHLVLIADNDGCLYRFLRSHPLSFGKKQSN